MVSARELKWCSGALRREPVLGPLREETRWPDQVLGSAAENGQPVHCAESSIPDLRKRAGLLQPAVAFLNEPRATLADRVAGVTRRSPIEVAVAYLLVVVT